MKSIRERYLSNCKDLLEIFTSSAIVFVVSLIWTITPAPGQWLSVLLMIITGLILLVAGLVLLSPVMVLVAKATPAIAREIYIALVVSPWALLVQKSKRVRGREVRMSDAVISSVMIIVMFLLIGLTLGGMFGEELESGRIRLNPAPILFFLWASSLVALNWVAAYTVRFVRIVSKLGNEVKETVGEARELLGADED